MWHGLIYGEPVEHIDLVFSDIIVWLGKRNEAAGCPKNVHWDAESVLMAAESDGKLANDSLVYLNEVLN